MSESEDREDLRSQLYQRFYESLERAVSERFFEEDELIDIFDYAGDLGDAYVRWEVLFCGERLYPESDELRARRAILYRESMPGSTAGARYLEQNQEGVSVLWEIERLGERAPEREEAKEALDELLKGHEMWEDEELIRLISLAASLGCTDWLEEQSSELRKRATYLPLLLYMLGTTFSEEGCADEAARCFEELTRLEPFEALYWALLCAELAFLGRNTEAGEAFEFARELEMSDPEVAVLLGDAVRFGLTDYAEKAICQLEKALESNPDYYRAVERCVRLMVQTGKKLEAQMVLVKFAERNPRVRESVTLAVDSGFEIMGNIFEWVNRHTRGSAFSLAEIIRMCEHLSRDERYIDLMYLCSGIERANVDIPEIRMLYVMAAYREGHCDWMVEGCEGGDFLLELLGVRDEAADACVMLCESYRQLGFDIQAEEFAAKAVARIEEVQAEGKQSLALEGAKRSLERFLSKP